jgi:hypothetical protein
MHLGKKVCKKWRFQWITAWRYPTLAPIKITDPESAVEHGGSAFFCLQEDLYPEKGLHTAAPTDCKTASNPFSTSRTVMRMAVRRSKPEGDRLEREIAV